ncbi:hypothetical protein ACFPFV_12445 [Salinicoccus siamensis]
MKKIPLLLVLGFILILGACGNGGSEDPDSGSSKLDELKESVL